MTDKCDVTFKSKMSKSEYCFCTACHDTGWVMKVTLPETRYFDGNGLTTALDWPEEE